MLPDTSLLRKLPLTLNATQRLRLEALVFSTDLLVLALNNLRHLATLRGAQINEITDVERKAMFVQAWAIVDHTHVVRQLLVDLANGKMGPKSTKFCSDAETATLLRNKMDHLHTNVGNLAKQKGMRAPLFGALTYLVVEPHQVKQRDGQNIISGATAVTVMAGTVPDGKLMFPMATTPRGIPASAFKLFAFDREFDLEAAVLDLQEIMISMDNAFTTEINDQIDAIASRTGTPIDQLMAPALGGLAIAASIVYDEENATS
jgi:hypothetical protein